jgi:hypothetical protein
VRKLLQRPADGADGLLIIDLAPAARCFAPPERAPDRPAAHAQGADLYPRSSQGACHAHDRTEFSDAAGAYAAFVRDPTRTEGRRWDREPPPDGRDNIRRRPR